MTISPATKQMLGGAGVLQVVLTAVGVSNGGVSAMAINHRTSVLIGFGAVGVAVAIGALIVALEIDDKVLRFCAARYLDTRIQLQRRVRVAVPGALARERVDHWTQPRRTTTSHTAISVFGSEVRPWRRRHVLTVVVATTGVLSTCFAKFVTTTRPTSDARQTARDAAGGRKVNVMASAQTISQTLGDARTAVDAVTRSPSFMLHTSFLLVQ